jgi:hypothetical protein
MFDAAIGCWTAKLTYWFIRPLQTDPGIKLNPRRRPAEPSVVSVGAQLRFLGGGGSADQVLP